MAHFAMLSRWRSQRSVQLAYNRGMFGHVRWPGFHGPGFANSGYEAYSALRVVRGDYAIEKGGGGEAA